MGKRRILIPLDGSEFSRQIISAVTGLFDARETALVLFRAALPPVQPLDTGAARNLMASSVASPGSYEAYNSMLEQTYRTAEHEAAAFLSAIHGEVAEDAARLRDAGFTVKTEVQLGEPAGRIVQYVNDNPVDMIAMATHGRSGFSRMVMGSVAEKVLRGVTVPVLMLRPNAERGSATEPIIHGRKGAAPQFIVATDGSTFGRRAVLSAVEVAAQLHAHLTVLVIAGPKDGSEHAQQIMRETAAVLEEVGATPETVPLVGFADEVLLKYLEQHPCDLFLTGAFGDRSAGGTAAMGPTAFQLVHEATVSTLLFKGRRSTFRKVLVSVGVEDNEVVRTAAQFAAASGAELHVLHVVPPSAASYLASTAGNALDLKSVLSQGTHLSAVLRDWEVQLQAHGYDQSVISVQKGTVPETLLQVAREGDYDLVVVGSESTPAHFRTSIASSVARFAEQSVLIVRGRR